MKILFGLGFLNALISTFAVISATPNLSLFVQKPSDLETKKCENSLESVKEKFKEWARQEKLDILDKLISRFEGELTSKKDESAPPLQISGIFPSLAVTETSGPVRSECGTGALMPWNDRLYMVSYMSIANAGSGTGFYAIDKDFKMEKLADHNSTYANRIIHRQTNQIVIGAWLVDMKGTVRVFEQLLHVRITATAEHLTEPDTKVYMLGMDGPLWECNVVDLNCTKLFDLEKELNIPHDDQKHFKGAHTMNGRLVVASNTFTELDFNNTEHGGRLAEWYGPGTEWKIIEETAFVEVTGRHNFGQVIYATGWDFRSVILKTFDPEVNKWQTYRMPKGSHAFDHLWQTEWPRIREVETERYLMDISGMFYELSPLGWAGSTWGINPIARHIRVIPDFTSFRGTLVLGGNEVSPVFESNMVTGQAQSGLWFGKTDDLWSFGKPMGWGAVWRNDTVCAGQVSDPFLMNGFDKKVAHVILRNCNADDFSVYLEADITGAAGHRDGDTWVRVVGDGEWTGNSSVQSDYNYRFYTFPSGFSAQWVRVGLSGRNNFSSKTDKQDACCTVTAYFMYT